MGLVGNLEDLGLGDILQIVSLSKKSGVLSLSSDNREGTIMFLEGQVVRAVSSLFRENLGDILLKYKLIDTATLEQALVEQAQETNGQHQPLGNLLAERYGVSQDKIEAVIKTQIERIVYSFFTWTDGTFAFHLDEPESFGAARLDPLDFMLEQGLSPQWLALEGRRLVSEGRLLSSWPGEETAVEEPFEGTSPVAVESVSTQQATASDVAAGTTAPLLIIDDDAPTRSVLSKAFTRAGFEVESFALASELLEACARLVKEGKRPALLIDLIMPRHDGHGILGGLEVMELVEEKYRQLPMMLMTDHPNAEAESKARELGGLAVLQKPKKIEIREHRGVEALKTLIAAVGNLLAMPRRQAEQASENYHLGADLLQEIGEEVATPEAGKAGSPGLYLLKGMLQELASPLLGGGIILLTLRFASELLSRAVIFDVRDGELVGLGQFGLDTVAEQADEMVRKMRLQVTPNSVLSQVLEQKVALKTRLSESPVDQQLRQQLGGESAAEVFLGPLVSEGKVVALLYGDNLPERKAIGDVEAFEVFLSQAGMTMEKVLLERRLNSRQAN